MRARIGASVTACIVPGSVISLSGWSREAIATAAPALSSSATRETSPNPYARSTARFISVRKTPYVSTTAMIIG